MFTRENIFVFSKNIFISYLVHEKAIKSNNSMTDVEKLQRDYILSLVEEKYFHNAVTSSGIKRLMWKAGVVRLPNETIKEVRIQMANELFKVVKRLLILHDHQNRSTITPEQLELVLKLDGYVLAASSATLQQASKSSKKTKKQGAPRAKQGRIAARNVKNTQKTTGLLLRASPFERLVRHIADPDNFSPEKDENNSELRFSHGVIRLIQLYVESHIVKLLKAASIIAFTNKLKGVKDSHIRAAVEVSDILN